MLLTQTATHLMHMHGRIGRRVNNCLSSWVFRCQFDLVSRCFFVVHEFFVFVRGGSNSGDHFPKGPRQLSHTVPKLWFAARPASPRQSNQSKPAVHSNFACSRSCSRLFCIVRLVSNRFPSGSFTFRSHLREMRFRTALSVCCF